MQDEFISTEHLLLALSQVKSEAKETLSVNAVGHDAILNALTGALVIAVMRNGLNLLGMGEYWQMVIKGFVVVGAVRYARWKGSSDA